MVLGIKWELLWNLLEGELCGGQLKNLNQNPPIFCYYCNALNFITSKTQNMVQNTKTIPINEEKTDTPQTETKTISVSIQITYEQILGLALQLAKVDKKALMEALGESLVDEEKEELIEEQQETIEKDGKEEKQAYQSWLDKDFYKFDSTTVEKINSGEFTPKRLNKEQLKQLFEQAKEAWKDDPITDEELNRQIKEHL